VAWQWTQGSCWWSVQLVKPRQTRQIAMHDIFPLCKRQFYVAGGAALVASLVQICCHGNVRLPPASQRAAGSRSSSKMHKPCMIPAECWLHIRRMHLQGWRHNLGRSWVASGRGSAADTSTANSRQARQPSGLPQAHGASCAGGTCQRASGRRAYTCAARCVRQAALWSAGAVVLPIGLRPAALRSPVLRTGDACARCHEAGWTQ
jgi:hypothetical protein